MMSKLQDKRLECNLSQSQLAKASGVNVRLIQHYEQGFRDINRASVVTVMKLAEALGCEIQDVLDDGIV